MKKRSSPLGPLKQGEEGYWRGRAPRANRIADKVWQAMLACERKGKDFSAREIAAAARASVRYVRSYCVALAAAGYLYTPAKDFRRARRYRVGGYRDELAPQMAGGSGGGKGLGKGWKQQGVTV